MPIRSEFNLEARLNVMFPSLKVETGVPRLHIFSNFGIDNMCVKLGTECELKNAHLPAL